MDSPPLKQKPGKVEVTTTQGAHSKNNTTTITIDLAKDIFQVAAFIKYGNSMINLAIIPKKVKLIPPHIVVRYRDGNKNDKNDAVAIYEAAKNPNIYFVTIRTLEQQDLATQHK